MTTDKLARTELAGVPLYQPDGGECAVDLSDNTNLWGAPPAALRAIRAMSDTSFTRYPSIYSAHLRPAILRYVGLEGTEGVSVVAGCGSDDVIDATMRAFGHPGDRVAYCAPTFSMVPAFARVNGLSTFELPFTSTYDIDAERLVEAKAQITYLCTPNNPTGTSASRAAVEYVVENARGIVLLDAAYAEFTGTSYEYLLARSEKLVVARTFSKAFGLAGLRIGYGVGATALTQMCERARGPYKVNAVAEHAALGALENSPDGVGWVAARATEAVEVRKRFTSAVEDVGFAVLPSDANFVLIPYANARAVFDSLRLCGVLVRLMPTLQLNGMTTPALRVSIGPWSVMETVVAALAEVVE